MRAALYARFSTDKQSSTADQLRVCRAIAERHGFTVVAEYSDEAISGGTANRPGYQQLLAAARCGAIDVIVAEDTSRLWRNLAEQSPRDAELRDLGVHVVTHDLDTRSEASGWMGPILGASAQQFRQEIARRTRRSLEGRARDRKPTGGRAYGYTSTRNIIPEQAEIVREVFARFAAGETLLAICSDLNVRAVPSPGANWSRKTRRRDGAWMVSALHAMLKNDVYIGRIVWNRRRWIRSAVDSTRRRAVMNPPEAWIVHERPELRLVDDLTWQRVQRRLAERREFYRPGPGGRAQYLLSGLLRCGVCGGAMVIAAHRPVRYACSSRRHGGPQACSNDLLVRQEIAEKLLLEPVLDVLLSPESVDLAVKEIRELARQDAKPSPPGELLEIDAELVELQRMSKEGKLSATSLAGARQALQERRREVERRHRQPTVAEVVFDAAQAYREAAASMREVLQGDDVAAGREVLREMFGELPLTPGENVLWVDLKPRPLALEATSGGVNRSGSGGRIWNGLRVPLPARKG